VTRKTEPHSTDEPSRDDATDSAESLGSDPTAEPTAEPTAGPPGDADAAGDAPADVAAAGAQVPEEIARDRAPGFRQAAAKVRQFPQTPGVYLMKDAAGRLIYVGKAKNLRARAGSYFLKAAAEDRRTADLVREIADIDYLPADSEVDALLTEARLIKDVQPKYNVELKDDKTFPYLEITSREEFPRIAFTREPRQRGSRLYGPFASAGSLRGASQVLQKIFKFRTCSLDISEDEEKWRWFRPCLLASTNQCTAPCNWRITAAEYRQDVKRLRMVLMIPPGRIRSQVGLEDRWRVASDGAAVEQIRQSGRTSGSREGAGAIGIEGGARLRSGSRDRD